MSQYTAWYYKRRRILIEEFGGKCVICNSTNDLVFHHNKPTKVYGIGRGSYRRINDVRINRDCYQLLCESCHTEYHYKHIDD